MSERLRLVRIDCDGCGIAGLEFREHRRDEVFEECGWLLSPGTSAEWSRHFCPRCRPDSPIAAVEPGVRTGSSVTRWPGTVSPMADAHRVDCDGGCKFAALEYPEGYRDEAFEDSGWIRDAELGRYLCPVCRPDSPFEAVKRVRALAEQASTVIARGCTCSGDDCTGRCRRGEPMGWDLDPAQVLAALGSVQHDQSVGRRST